MRATAACQIGSTIQERCGELRPSPIEARRAGKSVHCDLQVRPAYRRVHVHQLREHFLCHESPTKSSHPTNRSFLRYIINVNSAFVRCHCTTVCFIDQHPKVDQLTSQSGNADGRLIAGLQQLRGNADCNFGWIIAADRETDWTMEIHVFRRNALSG